MPFGDPGESGVAASRKLIASPWAPAFAGAT